MSYPRSQKDIYLVKTGWVKNLGFWRFRVYVVN
jgi:hypothetical protein